MRLQVRELLVERREQVVEVRCSAIDARCAGCQPPERCGNLYRDTHFYDASAASAAGNAGASPATRANSPSLLVRYASNSTSFGASGVSASYSFASTSVVFSPLPVMQSTVVSSGRIRS